MKIWQDIKIAINRVVAPTGYAVRRRSYFNPLESLFHRYLHDDFFFIQIGANDGVTRDPIYHLVTENKVPGLVVEPIPDYFEKLKRAYRNYPQITPVNAAIHATQRQVTMYRVNPAISPADLPYWANGIASLDPGHHRLSGISDSAIIPQTVPAMSFDDLLRQHGVSHVDFLQIDTEGYDFEIIRMANIDKLRPKLICFEHGLPHKIMSRETFQDCTHYLLERGYLLIVKEYDVIAYLP